MSIHLTKSNKLSLLAIFLLLAFSAQSTVAGDDWTIIRSENFQMVGNAKEKELRRVAVKLEQFRYAFNQLFPKMKFNSPIPTNVVVFKDEKSFKNFKPQSDGKRRDWVAGYFQPGEDVNYIVLSAEGERAQTYRTIFHEYTHFLINNNFGKSNVPPWLNEGYAEYFEHMLIEKDKKITLGGLNGNHLRLLARTELIPLETFFEIDYYSLNRQTSDGVGVFYAQAWALMHYFWHSNEGRGRRDEMNRFLTMILNGEPPKQSFERAFQTDYQTVENELKKYVRQRSYKTLIFTSKTDLEIETQLTVAPLDEGEAKAFQGDLLYHANRIDEAAAYLDEAIRIKPQSSLANTALGLVRMKQKDFPAARRHLEKAVQLDPDNYAVHYNYAYVLSREGMNQRGFAASFEAKADQLMRASLRRAIALNPDFSESYNLFAFISLIQNTDLDESIEMLKKALRIAPGNQWYLLRMSELYLRKEEFANARKIAQSVYRSASDNQLRGYAQNTLRTIDDFQSRAEMIREKPEASTRSYVITTDKPMTEEEIRALQKEMMNKSINRMLRQPQSGEKRITGFIIGISCEKKNIEYSVKTPEGEVVVLTSQTFQNLHLAAYNVNLIGLQFACDASFPDNLAVISYLPKKGKNTPVAGEIVSIEMVPNDFQLTKSGAGHSKNNRSGKP